jgi:hypothetical protein
MKRPPQGFGVFALEKGGVIDHSDTFLGSRLIDKS